MCEMGIELEDVWFRYCLMFDDVEEGWLVIFGGVVFYRI